MGTKRHPPQILWWKELYNPTTYTFQIWLAVVAFSISIVVYLLRFIAGWWNMLGVKWLVVNIPQDTMLTSMSWVEVFFGIIGTIFLFLVIGSLLSLACVTLRAWIGIKVKKENEYPKQNDNIELLKRTDDIKGKTG